jgi:NAD(P)-dependent dehydrogenase (short-subunit alcohol dehydrogenase family)
MTKALSWELGPYGIRVNTVAPTFIETEMTAPFLNEPGFRDDVISRIALGRLGTLRDIAGAIVYLASEESSLMTGTTLKLDGGWTAV